MCYNKELSMALFLVGTALILKYAKRYTENHDISNIAMALFIAILATMQLNEFFIHLYKDPSTLGHQISAVFLPISLMFQLFLILVVFLFVYNSVNSDNVPGRIPAHVSQETHRGIKNAIIGLFTIGLLIFLYFMTTVVIPNFGTYDCTPPCESGCRLLWNPVTDMRKYNTMLFFIFYILYFVMTSIFVYYLFDKYGLMLYLFTWVFSFVLYPNNQWSSFFCIFYFFIMLLLIVYDDNLFVTQKN